MDQQHFHPLRLFYGTLLGTLPRHHSLFRQKMKPTCDRKSSLSVWKTGIDVTTNNKLITPSKNQKNSLIFLKYLRIFLTVVQWLSHGSDWYRLVILKTYATSGRVQIITYMIDPIEEAYGILLMRSRSSCVEGHWILLRVMPWDIGKKPFMESCILNLCKTLSI